MPPTPMPTDPGALRRAVLFELLRQQNRAQEVAARRPRAGAGEADEIQRFQYLAVRSWGEMDGAAPR